MQPLLLSSFFCVKLLVKFYFMKTRENFFRIAFYFIENKLISGIELFSPSRWLKINSACFLYFEYCLNAKVSIGVNRYPLYPFTFFYFFVPPNIPNKTVNLYRMN